MATKLIYPAYDGFVGAVLDMQTCDYEYSRRKSNVYYDYWLLMRRTYNPIGYGGLPSVDNFVRAFIDFDISLPGGVSINDVTKVELIICAPNFIGGCELEDLDIDITGLAQAASLYPDTYTGNSQLLGDISTPIYLSAQPLYPDPVTIQEYTLDLGAAALANLKSQATWFSIGLKLNNEAPTPGLDIFAYLIGSRNAETTYYPRLRLTYPAPPGRRRILCS